MSSVYLNYILEQLKSICAIPSPSGYTERVINYVMEEFCRLGYEPRRTVKGGVLVDLGGEETNDGILLYAHVDTLGGMVCSVKDNGRLRISPVGGLQANNTETENCTIVTRFSGTYTGTLQVDNASVHVNGDYGTRKRDFSNMEIVIDEKTFSKADTFALGISAGDYVCFDPRTVVTETGFVKSRFLDDKLSVAILLGYARYLKEQKVKLKRRTFVHITVYEEVGHGGASSVPGGVTELLGVDMGCVGDGLNCNEFMVSICAKDSRSPSSYNVVTQLIKTAKESNIDYAVDVYPHYSSDVDVTLMAGCDATHALIGAGVYASHGYERTHIDGIMNTFDLIKAYIS